MIFLIEFDRASQLLVQLREYPDRDRATAQADRLDLELRLNRSGVTREVVLLEANSLETLHKTHRRYFETLESLASEIPAAVEK
jgi:hypothetical protein